MNDLETALATVEQTEKIQVSVGVVQHANTIAVISDGTLAEAATLRKVLEQLEQDIHAGYDDLVTLAHTQHKAAIAKRAFYLDPVVSAKNRMSREMGSFETERQRQADQERRRLEAEASAKLEQERKVLEQQRLEQAAAVAAAGDQITADLILEQAVTEQAALASAPVIVAPPRVEKVEGASFRENWKYEIVNAAVLPTAYLMPNDVAIGAAVRTQKAKCNIPGVKVWCEKVAIKAR